jgi:hypothetical protein
MKKILLTALALVSANVFFAQTADEIIDKYYTAVGGKDKWLKLTSTVQTAEMNMQGTTINLKIYSEHNKANKTEISFQGMTGYQLLTNKEGWGYMPFQGQMKAEPFTKEQVEKGQTDLDLQGDLLNYKEKGTTVEYLGKEDLDGTECFKMKVVLKNGKSSTYFFDASSYYLIKVTSKTEVDGKEVEAVMEFSNFQKTPEGYIFPMAMSGMGPGPMKVTKIEVNTKIDPKVFEPSNK